jgi:hypothetical protein
VDARELDAVTTLIASLGTSNEATLDRLDFLQRVAQNLRRKLAERGSA